MPVINPSVTAPQFSIIVAMDQNAVIGVRNKMPWNIPEDLAYFRKTTLNHTVIMGKKTYLSIGKALEQRSNLVLSRDSSFTPTDAIRIGGIEELGHYLESGENFVIGGASVFQQFLPLANRLYITQIHAEFDGDIYFPYYDKALWELSEFESVKSQSGYELSFNRYIRKA